MSTIHDSSHIVTTAFLPLSENEVNGLVLKEDVLAPLECSAPNRIILTARDDERKRLLYFRPGCKKWACPACAEANRRRWVATIAHGTQTYIDTGIQFWFVTLTMHENVFGLDNQIRVWRSAWGKLYDRMKRYVGGAFLPYALLPELAPETDRFHVHGMFGESFGAHASKTHENRYSCRFLHDAPRQCGLGYANDVKPVLSAGAAAAYTAGYVGKTLGVLSWPEQFKRVRTSVRWPELPKMAEGESLKWGRLADTLFEPLVSQMWSAGYDVVNVSTGEVLEIVDLTRPI